MWIEFVVGSCLAPPSSPVFLPLQKITSTNSNSARIEDVPENQLRLTWLPL